MNHLIVFGKKSVVAATCISAMLVFTVHGQTPIYSLDGTTGTGGGTAGVSVAPTIAPSGSSGLNRIAGNNDYSFGTGVNGAAGHAIVNSGTYGSGTAGVLAGTIGNAGTLGQFSLTMWINPSASPANNNERLLEISSGGTPTTASLDGDLLFFGINAGGGLQFYVNNVNGNSIGTDISTPTDFNGGLSQVNNWYFLAVTYDNTAGNYLLYTGNNTANSVALAYTYSGISAAGLNLSTARSIFVANRPNETRAFPGSMDDINLYSGALTLSDLQGIQNTQLVPEPSIFSLLGLGLLLTFRHARILFS